MYKYYKPDFTIISTMIRNNYSTSISRVRLIEH